MTEDSASDFRKAAREGLRARPKGLSSKWLYDERGSALFDQICELPTYYPTRTELALLERHLPEVTDAVGPGVAVVEPGSGAGIKSRLLLDALERPAAFVPIEISADYLATSTERLKRFYPELAVYGLQADFNDDFEIPEELHATPRLLFFPGSTIGNLEPHAALEFMARMRRSVGADGFLIGVDLKKSPDILIPAYDDPQGVTAAFNLNMLRRLRDELGATVDPEGFRHEARWNAEQGRMEMHLVARAAQAIVIDGEEFAFQEDESIHTENSYKYAIEEFVALAAEAGWTSRAAWVDERDLFSLHLLEPAS